MNAFKAIVSIVFLFVSFEIKLFGVPLESIKQIQIQDEPIFTSTEILPTFIGGSVELNKYLTSNIKYPLAGNNDKKEKRVFTKFIVEKDGSISNVTIMKGVNEALDQDAKRVVENMPKWNPAKQSFRYVRCYYHLTIDYK